jgi:hypothetical protein
MHLMIGTPCYGGLVTQRYMQSICSLIEHTNQTGLAVSVELLGYDSLITRSRNTIVAKFLDMPTTTHLMFIDADIGFTAAQVERMLSFDREVVAGMYPLKIIHYDESVLERIQAGENLESAQLRYVGALEPEPIRREIDGFVTGEFAGAGFLLIKREALQKLLGAYPETRYTAAHNQPTPDPSLNKFAIFDCLIEPETGHYLSEDYAFCYRWRTIGGDLWLDTRSQLMHIGPREFVGDTTFRYQPTPSGGSE